MPINQAYNLIGLAGHDSSSISKANNSANNVNSLVCASVSKATTTVTVNIYFWPIRILLFPSKITGAF